MVIANIWLLLALGQPFSVVRYDRAQADCEFARNHLQKVNPTRQYLCIRVEGIIPAPPKQKLFM